MKYKIARGPYLVGYLQLRINRVEGTVEALSTDHKKTFIEADRHAQALCLQKHPMSPSVFFVGTDEGCIHKGSLSYPHQHLSVLQAHHSGVYAIEFSPFSPKIFITAGSDWKIRVWIENISEPIIELSDGFLPFHNAVWSPQHSTIIASCTRDSVQIWDLGRVQLEPASIRTFDSKQLTMIKFSHCGRSLLVGDNEGNTHVCALEDFPFAPHYQLDELQKIIHHALSDRQDLEKQIKQLGFLGVASEKI
jgi:WD40 repeat protein